MRALICLALLGCSTGSKPKPAYDPASAIGWIKSFADRACGCNNDKDCVHAIRDEYDQQSRALFKSRGAFAPSDQGGFDAEFHRFAMCGDAAGLTIWKP
jgi:hypothetical protein